jgi:hypothetical protein
MNDSSIFDDLSAYGKETFGTQEPNVALYLHARIRQLAKCEEYPTAQLLAGMLVDRCRQEAQQGVEESKGFLPTALAIDANIALKAKDPERAVARHWLAMNLRSREILEMPDAVFDQRRGIEMKLSITILDLKTSLRSKATVAQSKALLTKGKEDKQKAKDAQSQYDLIIDLGMTWAKMLGRAQTAGDIKKLARLMQDFTDMPPPT